VYHILAINPGSTSTKLSYFEDEDELFAQNLHHSADELAPYARIVDQLPLRLQAIENFLAMNHLALEKVDAFVGRGGLLAPLPGGTYLVNDKMVQDLYAGVQGEHASNLGGIIAAELAGRWQKPAFIVDPVVVDELQPVARLSGHPQLARVSIFHALNQKMVARLAAIQIGKAYTDLNLIVVHLGGGISVAAHKLGRVIDVNNALDGDGPFSPERSGSLPVGALVKLCFSGKYNYDQIKKMIVGQGGMIAYLGSNNMLEIVQRKQAGDELAGLVYEAMAYQVAKEIGAMSAVLSGIVDAVVMTGGIAYDKEFTGLIAERIRFIAPVYLIPGEEEMTALCQGALRVLRQEEPAAIYAP